MLSTLLKTTPLPRIARCTILGESLPVSDLKTITGAVGFRTGENLHMLYKHSDSFGQLLSLVGEIYVGVTSERIFKLEKGRCYQTPLDQILSVRHVLGGLFAWDRVEIVLRDGKIETYGVYYGDACLTIISKIETLTAKQQDAPSAQIPGGISGSNPGLCHIYELLCVGGFRYIGKVLKVPGEDAKTTVDRRKKQHGDGDGSAFTAAHHPVEIVRIIEDQSPFTEDAITIEKMSQYGIPNVRGGSFSQLELSSEQREMIQRAIRGAKDACMTCGDSTHFARHCPAATSIIRSKAGSAWTLDEEKKLTDEVASGKSISDIANLHKRSETAISMRLDEVKSRAEPVKATKPAPVKPRAEPAPVKATKPIAATVVLCERCGRNSHQRAKCYAKMKLDGSAITE